MTESLFICGFKDEEDGIRLANDCKYGLGAGVWTSDISRGHRVAARIEAGIVWVNTHHRNDPSSPWGGMKESGIGRENGVEAFESCELDFLCLFSYGIAITNRALISSCFQTLNLGQLS